MDPLDDLLKAIDHTKRAPLPEGFENNVLNKWFEERPKVRSYPFLRYAVAACIIACTFLNIYYLSVQTNVTASASESATDSTFEEHLVNEYGLIEPTSYYSFVE